MSVIATCTSAVFAALLVTLPPASANASGTLTRLPITAWQRPWPALPKLELTPPSAASAFDTLPAFASPRLALTFDRQVTATWTARLPVVPLELELIPRPSSSEAAPNGHALLSLGIPTEVPPLIRYTDETTDVTLSISPGSPCTGACLKLAGSF